jgi:quinol monooxygenase YgiN
MKFRKHMLVLAVGALATFSASAQTSPGNIAAMEYQTPKAGMAQQYEQGRKQKADWHKQQKDNQPLYVFETISGDRTGTYLVGRLDQHWADFDKPAIPDAADTEEFNKVIGSYVQTVTDRYYEFLPKLSNPDTSSTGPAKFTELVTFQVHRDKIGAFRGALARLSEAVQKTKWPVHYEFYELANGGLDGTFVLAEPHANWADFEEKPDVKPFRDMLKEAFGQNEADAVYDRLESSIESEYSEILQFRSDLSYIPAK